MKFHSITNELNKHNSFILTHDLQQKKIIKISLFRSGVTNLFGSRAKKLIIIGPNVKI
jgi:hypothetical protein